MTLVFKNTVPPQAKTDPAYLAQLDVLRQAIKCGARITAVMELPENGKISIFSVDVPIIKIVDDCAVGILPLRPPINNDATPRAANGLVCGSVDTCGNYVYKEYRFGSDTWNASAAPANDAQTYPGYVISWYAD